MGEAQYRGLIAFTGSRARALTLGVLANAETALSGYRVAKIANLPQIKVYQVLRAASRAGLVGKSSEGYRLLDQDLRLFLRKQIRLRWSEAPSLRGGGARARAKRGAGQGVSWFDPTRYRSNPKIARRYRGEFVRPPEKDQPFSSGRPVGSRKR